MQYTGQSAYVPQQGKTVPVGDYQFIVSNAAEMVSEKGNSMIKLELLVAIPGGEPLKIFDHLVFMDSALFKIEQFCKAVGMPERFQIGVNGLPAIDLSDVDCLNKQGLAHLVVGDKGYMVVKWYVDLEKAKKPTAPTGVYQASPTGVRPPTTPPAVRPAVPANRPPMPQARPVTPPPAKVAFTPAPAVPEPTVPEPTVPEIPDAPLEDDNFNPDDIPF